MKKISLLLTVAAAFSLTSAATAQTYVGVSGGASQPHKSKNKGETTAAIPATAAFPAIPTDTPIAWTTKFDTGYNISGQVGHRFSGGFRAEAEFVYNRSGIDTHSGLTVGGTNIDAVDSAVLTRGAAATTNPTVGAVIDSGIGKMKSYGAFANAYYDFNSGGSFQPFLGAGIGLQRVKVDFRPSNVDVGQGKDTKLSYQFMAGATYKIAPSVEVFGQYNFRDAGRTKLALDLLPANLRVKNQQSIFSLGLRVPFGGGQ